MILEHMSNQGVVQRSALQSKDRIKGRLAEDIAPQSVHRFGGKRDDPTLAQKHGGLHDRFLRTWPNTGHGS